MRTLGLVAFALAVLSGSQAFGQGFYTPPPTSPFARQPLAPYYDLYYGPGRYSLPPVGTFGGPRTGWQTPPTTPTTPIDPGLAAMGQVPGAAFGTASLTDSSRTGHPVAFMSYSRYFMNLG